MGVPANMQHLNMTFYNGTAMPVQNGTVMCSKQINLDTVVPVAMVYALVVCGGLIANTYMLVLLYTKGRQRKMSSIDMCFVQLGICDACTIFGLPVWLIQSKLGGRWIFGHAMCKLLRGTRTFFFQYGVCMLVYVNISRYIKIVHHKGKSTPDRKQMGIVSALCAVIPALSTIMDMTYWSTMRLTPSTEMCYSVMPATLKQVYLWLRMAVFFGLPIVVIAYCNGMIVYTIKRHVVDSRFKNIRHSYTKAALLPLITIACFVCCWTPWVISVLYFRANRQCNVATVVNVCTAIGHLYCLSNPILYIIVNAKRIGSISQSLRSRSEVSPTV